MPKKLQTIHYTWNFKWKVKKKERIEKWCWCKQQTLIFINSHIKTPLWIPVVDKIKALFFSSETGSKKPQTPYSDFAPWGRKSQSISPAALQRNLFHRWDLQNYHHREERGLEFFLWWRSDSREGGYQEIIKRNPNRSCMAVSIMCIVDS